MSQIELIEAIKSGNRASVAEMIESGAEINQQDKQGWTPLNWAAGSGQLEIVDLLLERGADPLAVGRDLRTPQMIALAAGHAEVVKRLRQAEADAKGGAVEESDRKYCTAFHASATCAVIHRGRRLRSLVMKTWCFCIRITPSRNRSGPVKT